MTRHRLAAKRILAYGRFSPRPNAQACESATNQLAEIRAAFPKVVMLEFRDEDLSGGDRERAGLLEAIDSVKRGDVLVVRDWSRLGRDTMFVLWIDETLRKRGARLYSLAEGYFTTPDDPATRMMSTILSAVAEWQRQLTKIRTSAAMRRHQANGRKMSGIAPYGWALDGKQLVEVAEEQAIIARMREWRIEGLSYCAIAAKLNAEGIAPRGNSFQQSGGQWTHKNVQRILSRT